MLLEIALHSSSISWDVKSRITSFVLTQLQTSQPRGDYHELLEVTLIFSLELLHCVVWSSWLQVQRIKHIGWQRPCTPSKSGYSELSLAWRACEEKGLWERCIFIVRLYTTAWYTCPIAPRALNSDLLFLQQLITYLWHLGEEMIGLAFFVAVVSSESKRATVKNLNEKEGDDELAKWKVHWNWTWKLRTKRSLPSFQHFQLPVGFLELDVALWNENTDYQHCLNVVHNIHVVNDTAEQAVSLIECSKHSNNCVDTDYGPWLARFSAIFNNFHVCFSCL